MKTKIAALCFVLAVVVAGVLAYPRVAEAINPVALMTILSNRTSCGVAATQIVPASETRAMVIGNISATPIFLGGSGVTSSTGYPICTDTDACPSSSVSLDVAWKAMYCIVSSATTTAYHMAGL